MRLVLRNKARPTVTAVGRGKCYRAQWNSRQSLITLATKSTTTHTVPVQDRTWADQWIGDVLFIVFSSESPVLQHRRFLFWPR